MPVPQTPYARKETSETLFLMPQYFRNLVNRYFAWETHYLSDTRLFIKIHFLERQKEPISIVEYDLSNLRHSVLDTLDKEDLLIELLSYPDIFASNRLSEPIFVL